MSIPDDVAAQRAEALDIGARLVTKYDTYRTASLAAADALAVASLAARDAAESIAAWIAAWGGDYTDDNEPPGVEACCEVAGAAYHAEVAADAAIARAQAAGFAIVAAAESAARAAD